MSRKVYIAYATTDNPHGGGNQFLKALKKQFVQRNLYAWQPASADIILFNSHQNIEEIVHLKKTYPSKKFVHRLDGPMRLYNNMSDNRDHIAYQLNSLIADATVFQSEWSRNKNVELGLTTSKKSVIIGNACDHSLFCKPASHATDSNKVRIISTSFSDNINKGFDIYRFLDKNLDFDKYEYRFAGRSPYEFENIKDLGVLRSDELANILKTQDIFITASKNDPCSNSLIEALMCGLPALALDSGGHPEIVQRGGLLFTDEHNLLNKIDHLSSNLQTYRDKIEVDSIENVADKYINFFGEV